MRFDDVLVIAAAIGLGVRQFLCELSDERSRDEPVESESPEERPFHASDGCSPEHAGCWLLDEAPCYWRKETSLLVGLGRGQINTNYLLPRIVVFDFDYTLIRGQLSNLKPCEMSNTEREAIFFDGEFLFQFCQMCVAHHHQLRIATHAEGSASDQSIPCWEELAILLDGVLPSSRSYLNDAAHLACWLRSDGKNSHLESIVDCTERSGEGTFAPYQVILIDDCEANIRKAQGAGYLGFLVDQRGLCREWLVEQPKLMAMLGFEARSTPEKIVEAHSQSVRVVG